jgi:diaminopimelate decarboxylase
MSSKILNRPAFNSDVINEMRRRHKKIFLGPIKTREELQQAKEVKADGYITDSITELQIWLDQGPAQ